MGQFSSQFNFILLLVIATGITMVAFSLIWAQFSLPLIRLMLKMAALRYGLEFCIISFAYIFRYLNAHIKLVV